MANMPLKVWNFLSVNIRFSLDFEDFTATIAD